jgi:hypothetical protein
MRDMGKRASIQPTYDSRETGPRYHVTTRVGGQTIQFEHRIEDPFVRQRVTIGWQDLLRALRRRRLVVEVLVGGDADVINDVMELDANCLTPNSTRRDEFNAGINDAIGCV